MIGDHEWQRKLAELESAADLAIDKYARGEATKQDCSDAQRKIIDFKNGKLED